MRRRPPARRHVRQGRRGRHPAPVEPQAAAQLPPRPYRERNLAERSFNTLKRFRRVATRCDKDLANHKGFVQLAAMATLLR